MSKYHNIKTERDGYIFDSKKEAARYQELVLLQLAGVIADLELQPKYDLLVNGVKIGTYMADFRYKDIATDETIVEDAKGVRTALYRRSKKHMKAQYGIDIKEV